MSFVSYAQAGEDILLWRALASRVRHEVGFYIDIGGFDPDHDSVTRAFYDHGWCGINAEPVRAFFQRFVERRPRDINLPIAVSDQAGKVLFHAFPEYSGLQLGTVVDQYASQHSEAGLKAQSYEVDALPLSDICDLHVGDRDIHFLKIDVEGHEAAVLRGMDFRRYRPWVLVIEAMAPNRPDILTHDEWDDEVKRSGYIYAGTALPNRYYVSKEHAELARYFSIAPDEYVRGIELQRCERLEDEFAMLQQRLADMNAREAARAAHPLRRTLRRLAGAR